MTEPAAIDARIDAFTAEAGADMYTAADAPAAPAEAPAPGGQPGLPAATGGWHANAARIERMRGPAGGLWAWGWDKAAEVMGLPAVIEYELDGQPRRIECRVSAAEKESVGEKLAQLLDAILPQSFGMDTENSRMGTIFMCLGAIAIIAKFKLTTLREASAVVEAHRKQQQQGAKNDGQE